ncbi:MAG: ABC transporter substrate-binding protein [Anaerolineae bacterium]
MKKIIVLGLLALILVVVVACGVPSVQPPTQPTATPVAITITDDSGRSVSLAEKPQRIISFAPSNTEILFTLGLGDKVVGVTEFCDYPEEAKAIEKIGGLEPNLEKVVSLSPDLILAIGGNPDLVAKVEELKIPILVLDPKDLEGIFADIELVGQATGAEPQAKKLIADLRGRVEAIVAKTKDVAIRPKVFYELDATDPTKPYTPGPGTWHDQLIELSGGMNIAAGAKSQWTQFSTEEIIAQDPEIIVLGDALWGVTAEQVKERQGWSVISAVKEGAIFPINDNLISRPGPRIVDGLEALARIVHPELFK